MAAAEQLDTSVEYEIRYFEQGKMHCMRVIAESKKKWLISTIWSVVSTTVTCTLFAQTSKKNRLTGGFFIRQNQYNCLILFIITDSNPTMLFDVAKALKIKDGCCSTRRNLKLFK